MTIGYVRNVYFSEKFLNEAIWEFITPENFYGNSQQAEHITTIRNIRLFTTKQNILPYTPSCLRMSENYEYQP